MKPIVGYWLEPTETKNEATADLGFEFPGDEKARPGLAEYRCGACQKPLELLAVYRKSSYIPLERWEAILLMMCRDCSRESDGFEGGNGYKAVFADKALLEAALSNMSRILKKPVHFKATPSGEPKDIKSWLKERNYEVMPKLGGYQLAIQGPRSGQPCKKCQEPILFVGSIEEKWAPDVLNFGFGMGYVMACPKECASDSVFFYWDC